MCKELCRDICGSCAKLVGYVLLLVTMILALFGIGGMIGSGIVLWSSLDITSTMDELNLPDSVLYVMFGFSTFIFLLNFCGCIGFFCAKKKAEEKLNGIMEDGDNEKSCCRIGMKIWIAFMILFGIIHFSVGLYSVVAANSFAIVYDVESASDLATSSLSKLSCKVEDGLFKAYGNNYGVNTWVDFQNYFECCGYSSYDTRSWTGDHCPAANTTTTTSFNSTSSDGLVSDTICESDDSWMASATPILYNQSSCGASMAECITGNQVTCSQRVSDLFFSSGMYLLFLGLFELFCAGLACCLKCCSNVPKEQEMKSLS